MTLVNSKILGKSSRPDQGSFADFACDETKGIESYTYADSVKKRVSDLGLVEPNRPRLAEDHVGIFHGLTPGQYFDGRLPTVIRSLTLDQLSALYSLYSNHYAYLVFKTKMVAAERSEAKHQKEFLWSHLRSQYKKIVDPKTGRKLYNDQAASDETRHDSRFVEYNSQYEAVNALYDILLAMCEVAEQDMKVISREVTIQQTKMEQDALRRGLGKRFESHSQIGEGFYGQPKDETPSEPITTTSRRVIRPKAPDQTSSPKPRGKPRGNPWA